MGNVRPLALLCCGLGVSLWACSAKDLSDFNAGSAGQAGASGGGAAGSSGAAGGGASGGNAGATGGTGASAGASGGGGTGASAGSPGGGGAAGSPGGGGTGGGGTGASGGSPGGGGTGGCVPTTTNTGWKQPETAADDGVGVPWSGELNAKTSNNQYAKASFAEVGITKSLDAGSFGFQVPASAKILGIEVAIERSATQTNTIRDEVVELATSGASVGVGKTKNEWPTTDVTEVYGSATDTWSAANLIPAVVNSSSFQVLLVAECYEAGRCSQGVDARVDEVRARVFFRTSCDG